MTSLTEPQSIWEQHLAISSPQSWTVMARLSCSRKGIYRTAHRITLDCAASLALAELPIARYWGPRPETPGGPVFHRPGEGTWLATDRSRLYLEGIVLSS